MLGLNGCGTILPSECFSPIEIGLSKMTAGEFVSAYRVSCRLVSQTKLNWIDPEFIRKRVDGAFDGEGSDGFAGSAHERIGDAVHLCNKLADAKCFHRVEVTGRKTKLLRKVVIGRLRGHSLMNEGGELSR